MDKRLLVLISLLKVAGGDIVAPAGLREIAIKSNEMEDNESLDNCMKVMDKVSDQDEKLKIISTLIWTQLLPSQMLKVHDVVHAGLEATLTWLQAHSEDREKPTADSFRSFLESLFPEE